MRFGLIHRVMTDALAVLGLLALLTSGELNRWMSGLLVAGLVAALAMPERWQERPWMRQASVVLPIALLLIQLARLFSEGAFLELAVEFAAALQVVRLATRRGAAHDQQVILLALVHLIAGTVLGGGLAYGLCFIGFLIVTPGALVLSHLRREVEGNYRQGARDRTGLPVDVPRILRSRRVIGKPFLAFTCVLAVPIFLFTALLFVAFPRVGLSLLLLNHSRPARVIGFSDRVDLGGVGKLRSDPTLAMRVEYPDLPEEPPPRLALYLRGTAFDQYDGRTWSRSLRFRRHAEQHGPYIRVRRFPDPARDSKLRIDLEPIDPPVMFLPPNTAGLKLVSRNAPLLGKLPTVARGPEGELKYDNVDERGIRYEVYLQRKNERRESELDADERQRYLTLPPDLDPRIPELAKRWVGTIEDPARQASLIEKRLRSEYQYDLESPSGSTKDPLAHFLFESHRGHCEFYSTAMAVLLRSIGVPTRNVTGFIGGTYNRFGGFYAVRQGDAHSWVEVHFDDQGWRRFDPTPPASAAPQSEITGVLAFARDLMEAAAQRWSRHVVGYDLKQQMGLFRDVRAEYSRWRGKSKLFDTTLGSPRRALILVVGLGLIVGCVVWLRRVRRDAPDKRDRPSARERSAREIVELYRSLEGALAANGVARQPGTPPLGHARSLAEMGHPLGGEILELTQLYVHVRFGGQVLSEEDRRDFARRVRALRAQRQTTAQAA